MPYPPHGGVLQRSYHVLRELCNEHEVHLLAFHHQDILSSEEKVVEAKAHLIKFCKSVNFVTLGVKKNKFHFYMKLLNSVISIKPFSVLAHESKEFRAQMEMLTEQHNIDLMHFDTIALAQYLTGVTKVKTLTHHNIESELMFRRAKVTGSYFAKLFFSLNAFKLARYEKKYIKRFSCNITCSEPDKKKLLNLIRGIRVSVVPNGVDTSFFVPKQRTEDNHTIVHVGALQSANLDGMVYFLSDIWPLIKKKEPQVRLILVGGNIPRSILELGKASSDILITGYVEDVRPYVWTSSVFIVPLRFGGGTKLKVLDALAMGKAIVSTSIGLEGIEVTPGKEALQANGAEEFADAVVELVRSPERRSELGEAGRILVENKYDWHIIGKLQREIFEKLLEEASCKP